MAKEHRIAKATGWWDGMTTQHVKAVVTKANKAKAKGQHIFIHEVSANSERKRLAEIIEAVEAEGWELKDNVHKLTRRILTFRR